MPNVIKLTVENPDEVLNAGAYGTAAVLRLQWSATEAGAFADVSGTGSTPTSTVLAATRSYTGYDPAGTSSTWYRTRFENTGATRVSDWSAAFQVGDETGGLLCSLYDVQQELGITANASNDELILEKITQVSAEIERYCGRWLAPRPTNPASTMTMNFDCPTWSRELLLTNDQRMVGIRTLTSLGIASTSQPETGGTYTAATLASVLLRPRPSADGPASRLVFNPTSGGWFYAGYNTAQAVGSFGPASVPRDIQAVAIAATVRRYSGKGAITPTVSLGPDGGVVLLADFSPTMMKTLNSYKDLVVA